MMKYMKYLSVMLAALLLISCSEEKLDPNSQIFDSSVEQNEFDEWLVENYITPYNIEFKYRMEYIESDMNYYLVPAEYDKSIQIAKLMIHLCLQAYDDVTGSKEFIKTYFPKMIHIIGSPAYRNNGTMVLGTAEGGLKITLYMINSLQLDPDYLNEYYFHTMHHEFAHILHQTKPYSSDFEMISGSQYVKDTWNSTFKSDEEAQQKGFITPYASSEANEDFVELLSTYITNTPKFWSDMLKTAGKEGSAIISQKFDIVYNYMKNTWGIDLDELQAVILKRQAEIDQLDLDTL
ncbi:MAG: putative zinc-binding metallopeptidase [Bacteroidales bacterium]|nr:putative zinc-binding metallopeptidase [Bacteroidales bacterium]